ncbi:MAG: hypothetical protein ACC661_01655 [Verrucomicrobiales bacterium]
MSGGTKAYRGKGVLELIEEAVHALRRCGFPVLAYYYVGALPFVLGFLFFWSEMARSSFALQRSVGASLALAMLYLWMKIWQSIFCRRVLESWSPDSEFENLGPGRLIRYGAVQVLLQAVAIPAQLAAFLLVVPFAWVYAIFQNATVLGFSRDHGKAPLRNLLRLAARQSNYQARENHLLILTGSVFAFFAWLNLLSVLVLIPILAKKFFGIESVFSVSPEAAYLNTTFVAVSLAVAFLCVSPLAKVVYTLRCFYGLSEASGSDLEWRLDYLRSRRAAGKRAALVAGLFVLGAMSLRGAERPPNAGAPAGGAITALEMDSAIEEVIHRSRYLWRFPREMAPEDELGPVARFFRATSVKIRSLFGSVAGAIDDLFAKFRRWIGGRDFQWDRRAEPSKLDWAMAMRGATYLVGALVLAAILVVAMRSWRRRHVLEAEADDEGVNPGEIDLESEAIMASQLPEEQWMTLAREQIERGEFRLAVRALFLASLASLGQRRLLRIERSKSNLDYLGELQRRGRSDAELQSAFGENVRVFERSWYGFHGVSREAVDLFLANCQRIASHG